MGELKWKNNFIKMKNILQNLPRSLIIAIPAIILSLYGIGSDSCFLTFLGACAITLRQFLVYFWITVIFFVIVYLFIFRKSGKGKKLRRNIIIIIFMILSWVSVWYLMSAVSAIQYYIRHINS